MPATIFATEQFLLFSGRSPSPVLCRNIAIHRTNPPDLFAASPAQDVSPLGLDVAQEDLPLQHSELPLCHTKWFHYWWWHSWPYFVASSMQWSWS
jgi:hypothetical protein